MSSGGLVDREALSKRQTRSIDSSSHLSRAFGYSQMMDSRLVLAEAQMSAPDDQAVRHSNAGGNTDENRTWYIIGKRLTHLSSIPACDLGRLEESALWI